MNAILKIGQEVLLHDLPRISGSTLDNDKYNPQNTPGVIVQIWNPQQPSLPYIVKWNNGYTNSYELQNLVKIE